MPVLSALEGTIAPPVAGEVSNLCYTFVLKLLKATSEYEEALRDEFVYNEVSQRDWQAMLTQLDYPLSQFLKDGSSLQSAFVDANEAYCDYVDFKLNEAVETLKNQSKPIDALFDALESVTDARFALVIWKKKLKQAGAVEKQRYDWSDDCQRDEWAHTFETMIDKLRKAIQVGDDLEICRYSRQTYLYREYLYVVAPNDVAKSRDGDLILLHEEALSFMREGQGRDHTQVRLSKMR